MTAENAPYVALRVSGHTAAEWATIPHVKAPALGIGACGFCGGLAWDRPDICKTPKRPDDDVRHAAYTRVDPDTLDWSFPHCICGWRRGSLPDAQAWFAACSHVDYMREKAERQLSDGR